MTSLIRQSLEDANKNMRSVIYPEELDFLDAVIKDRLSQMFTVFTTSENPIVCKTAWEIWLRMFPGHNKAAFITKRTNNE